MSLVTTVTKFVGRTGLKFKKASPEIMIIGGVACGIVAAVIACRQTLKADEIIAEHKDRIDRIHQAAELDEEYKENMFAKEVTATYVRTFGKFVKLYLVPIGLGAASVTLILCSHGIMKKRNLALTAAYNGVSAAFKRYRERVKEEYGEEADKVLRNPKSINPELHTNPITGEERNAEEVLDQIVMGDPSDYARVFDKKLWQYSNPIYNQAFLVAQQNFFNTVLHTRGHVMLSDVYDALGFDRTPASLVVGWVDGIGDNYIDFGIRDCGDGCYFLDFNVDGVVYDLI